MQRQWLIFNTSIEIDGSNAYSLYFRGRLKLKIEKLSDWKQSLIEEEIDKAYESRIKYFSKKNMFETDKYMTLIEPKMIID